MSDKIREALEARKLRKKKEEESFNEKQTGTEDKISSALKARESRIKNNLQTTFNDLESRVSAETEALKKASTTSWGIGNDGLKSYLESTRQNRINLTNIISEVDAYRKYLGDEKTDTLLNSLKGMENTYNTLTSLAEFRSKYDSEEEYQKDYDEAIKAQKDYEEITSFDLETGKTEIINLEDVLKKAKELDYTPTTVTRNGVTYTVDSKGNYKVLTTPKNKKATRNGFTYTPPGTAKEENTELQNFLKENGYSSIDEIEADISNKRAYLNRAKYIQEGIKITEEAKNAEDFDAKSQYVSTKADGFWDNVTADILGFNDSTYEYINNIDGYRSKYKDKHRVYSSDNPFSDGESSFEEKGYDYITEDEIKIYNYYYSTEGKEKAEKFLDSIQESLSYRKATESFGSLEGHTFLELLFGVEAGLDQFESGMKNLFNTSDDYIPQTSTQMISGMVREDLADDSIPIWYNFKEGKWEDKVLGSSLGQVSYDLINTTSNMLPSILTSTAIGFINPVAGQVVGAGLMGASASGNAYAEMLNLGYDKGQARLYSGLVGASEATLQYLLGGIGKLGGGKLTTEAVVKIANNMDNALARVAIKLGANAVGEFAEEYLQEVLNPLFKNMTLGTNEDVNLFTTDALYSGILGALSAGILEGGSTIASDVKATKLGKSVQKIDGGVERLKKLGAMFSADSVAYQIADKVTEETGAYKIGLLLQEAGATLSEQNVSDITTELTKKGMDEGAAQKIARSYQSFLNEEMSLTDEQVEVLEGLDPLADVLRKSIIGRNTDVYQRTREYNDLVKLATEEVTTPQVEVETTSQTFAPYSNEYIDKVTKEYESMGLPTELARAMAMAQLSTTVENETTPTEGKLSPTKENAVESEYDVSADGKTVNKKTDKIVNVKKITEISKSGEAKLALDDGTIVKASDLSFGTGAEALFVENISKVKIGKNPISTTSANTLYMHAMKALEDNPNMSDDKADSLIRGFIESYIYGAYNFGRSKLSEKKKDGTARLFAGELTQEQRKIAYELGGQDRASEVQKDQKFIDELKVGGKPGKKTTGTVVYEDGINIDKKALTNTQKANLEGIELLAKISSIEFHVFLSENSGDTFMYTMSDGTVTSANGWYVAGSNEIWIDLNAGNAGEGTMIRTAAHEISHYIKEWSPIKWQAMAELLVKDFSQKGVDIESMLNEQIDKIKSRYKKNKETMPSSAELREMAYEEFVSDALSDMLTDGSIVKFMAEVKAKDHTLWQKIKDAIKSLLDKWGLIIEDYKGRDLDTFEARALSQFEDTFKKLQKMYQDAFMDANEAYSAIGNVTGGENKNSTRSVDSNRKRLYNEYQTNAMQWVYSAATKAGDTKILNVNGKSFVLIEATEDGYIEIARGNYKEVKILEQQYREPNNSVYVYTAAMRNAKARYSANNSPIKNYREHEQGSRQAGRERLQADGTKDNEHLCSSDKRKSKQQKLKFSLRDDVNQNKVKRAYSFAKSRDSQLIKRAEEYESKNWSRESIFKETGLVRDPKGIWIYELDDRKMKFYPMGDARKKNDSDYKEYLKYEDIVNSYPSPDAGDDGNLILTEEQEKAFDRYCDLIEILEEKYGVVETLKDYVVHDELFEKYPQIGDAKFYISDLSKLGCLGYYDSQNNLICLDQSLYEGELENYTIESVVIHEIQHALQSFDERQNGSNEKYWNVRLVRDGHLPYSNFLGREPKPFEAYLLTAGEIEAREAELRRMYGDFARKNILPNLFWDSALYPDKELVSAEKDKVKYSMRTSEYTDSDYLEAVNRRDVKSLQQMVDTAARAAGYTERLYHQTGEDFTEFNTNNQKAGKFDYELPAGIFLKPSDKDIGLSGKKQMELYTRLQNPLHFGTRYVAADYWKRNIQGYADVSREITNIDRNYSAKLAQAQNETRSYISEWKSSHSKTPSSELYKDIEFQRLYDLESRITEEWEIKSNEASLRAKELINEFVSNGEYDGVIIDFDQGSGGRFTKTYITFDSSQLKSADLVTYDNNGNIIPLSERFNSDKTDIRFSQRNFGNIEAQKNTTGEGDVKLQVRRSVYSEYDKPITLDDVKILRSIGRKSIKDFTAEDVEKAQKWAYKFYQQLSIKSPFFRAWFGDWRAYDINETKFKTNMQLLSLDNPKKAKEYFKKGIKEKILFRGDIQNLDTGFTINVGVQIYNDTLTYANRELSRYRHVNDYQVRLSILNNIETIVKHSVLFDTEVAYKDSKKNPNMYQSFFHKFYTLAEIEGEQYLVRLTVDELNSDNTIRRAYNVNDIKISPVAVSQVYKPADTTDDNGDFLSNISISNLHSIVKQYDKSFNPKIVDKHLVNIDGTPKKFYHGTNAKFTEFNPNEFASREGSFFFAENIEDAKAYGDNVFEVYLTGNKFADYDNQPSEFYQLRDKRKQVEYLKERGYDGWYADMDSGGWGEVSVFSNTQIKSATENIGTFDKAESDIRYSEREPEASNRVILANVLESAAQNDIEKNKLAQYKEKISLIEAEEKRLAEIQKQLFTKGAVEPSQRKGLQFEAKQIANRINTYDRQLLKLEAAKPLQNVLTRERALAMKKQKQKYNESLARYKEKVAKDNKILLEKHQESRKKAIEGRAKTAMRHKIQKVVSELNQFLLRGTKDKHVMIGLQKSVAEALDAVNMDTVGADERVAKYNALIAKTKDPDVIASLTETRDRIQAQGDKLSDKLSKLKNAYNDIKKSEDPLIANSYDEVIVSRLEYVTEKVGNTALRDMTLGQLEEVYDMYKMVLTTIRNSNKAFKNAKNESITTLGNKVMKEVEETGGNKKYIRSAVEGIKKFGWNSLKPAYAFKVMGSNTFTEIYNTVRAGEDTWATDVSEAKDFYQEKTKKHNYNSWDFKAKHSFKSTSGKSFDLTLEQIMSLYAYSKREQADLHLRYGGFVFDGSIEITQKSKLGIPQKYKVNTADAHNLSIETLGEIIGTLTEEQKAFVDEMQDYLSSVMGEKGNEVSLEMYGVKLFKEKNYFPLKSAKQFMFEQTETAGELKIKNAGFSKETVPKANNPIVLNNFTDVWTNHVNEMSMYHSFVLPLEDFNRVFNYKTHSSDSVATESVKMFIQNAYGDQAVQYIKQLLTDLNGGARVDSSADWINKSIGLFKKAGVFASASVVIQQPSALARAWAYVNPKYFIFTKMGVKGHQKVWSEVKKYAPVAIIKEMGRFDTHVGQQTNDWIKSNQYEGFGQKAKALFTDSAYRDDVLSKAPAIADEIAWCYIWNAIKKETKATSKLLEGSEEFLKKCGERFTEVITLTQVYDSVLSRSGHMRSKDTGMKMATAFMAEPTTAMNMLLDAYVQGKRGNKNSARKIVGGVVSSIILNSILVSLVYAARDDDDDETYTEKYLGSLTAELINGFNPLTYIPFVKDLWSIGQGYNVERSDMSIYTKLWQSVENLFKEDMSGVDKAVDFAGSVANIFGLPIKNVARDTRAIFNVVNSILGGTQTTRAGMGYAFTDALRNSIPLVGRLFKEDSNSTKLYDAIVSGDQTQINRVKGLYKDDKAIESAMKKGLRENDSRIKEAAKARIDGDIAEYIRIVKDIKSEGYFSQDTIVASINAEINAISKGDVSATDNSATENKESSIYKIDDYYASTLGGDQATAYVVKEDIINTDVANGKEREEAEKSFNRSFTSCVREQYVDGSLSDYEAKRMLVNYGGKSEDEANSKVQYWSFKEDYPDYDDLSEEAFNKFYNEVKPHGISIDVYYDYYKQKAKCTGTNIDGDNKTDSGSVKREVLQVIDSLPLTYSQKDTLYYLNGWSSKVIYEAPWH